MLTNILQTRGPVTRAFGRAGLALRDGCIALAVTLAVSLVAVGHTPPDVLEAVRTAAGLGTDAPDTALRQLLFGMLALGCLRSATAVVFVSMLVRAAWAAGARTLRALSRTPAAPEEASHAR